MPGPGRLALPTCRNPALRPCAGPVPALCRPVPAGARTVGGSPAPRHAVRAAQVPACLLVNGPAHHRRRRPLATPRSHVPPPRTAGRAICCAPTMGQWGNRRGPDDTPCRASPPVPRFAIPRGRHFQKPQGGAGFRTSGGAILHRLARPLPLTGRRQGTRARASTGPCARPRPSVPGPSTGCPPLSPPAAMRPRIPHGTRRACRTGERPAHERGQSENAQ